MNLNHIILYLNEKEKGYQGIASLKVAKSHSNQALTSIGPKCKSSR